MMTPSFDRHNLGELLVWLSSPATTKKRTLSSHTVTTGHSLTGTKGKSGTEPFSIGSKFESPEAHFSTSWCLDPLLKLRGHLFSTGQWHHPILKGDI